ncbi:tensin-2 isoform X2 [Apteryx mantelli]|uniref:Tensin-2 isoform X2 n=1 Tax=Apteryx mantelli TaxID=2696672 RepID=A0ABM4FZD5_9AVES
MKPRGAVGTLLRALGRRDGTGTATPGKAPEPHSFREKVFKKKKKACAACKEAIDAQGLVCRVCKIASHKRCEAKVALPCQALPPPELRRNTAPVRRSENLGSTKSLNSTRQRSTLPRSFSLDQVMERKFDFDLTYITERIISVFFPAALEQGRYRAHLREVAHMLTSKHQDKYTLFNLSEKRRDIARLNPKVQDFGWPDLHAPPLDKLCSICKAMEGWLRAHPQHVAVLHCKGSKGKTGVIVAAYMHYSKISASADQALGTLTMRKFCEEKVASALQPSQRRYINYFSGLLSGSIKMNSNTLFLHHVLVPALPAFEPGAAYQPFLKIYQSMQLVYTSGVYSTSGAGTQSLCITLEPALLLKGDVMVKCYHKQSRGADRDVVFRVQFHTCTIHGSQLWFGKDELDEAWRDERFPFEASVEFVFSSGPEKIKGWDTLRNSPSVTVDYSISDPAVRWDSYEGFNVHHEDSLEELSHTRGPLDGSPYARVQKKRAPSPWGAEEPPATGSPLSPPTAATATEAGDDGTPGRPPPTAAERRELERLLGGFGVRPAEDERSAPCAAPAPSPCRRAAPAPQCSCRLGYRPAGAASPEGPRRRADGTLERRRPGYEVPRAGEGCPCGEAGAGEKRRVYRSLSEGFQPCGYGREALGYQPPGYREVVVLEELAPLCPCQDCQGRGEELAAAAAAFYGLRLERGAEAWGAGGRLPPPPPVAPSEGLEAFACPRCGRPGPLGLGPGRAPRALLAPRDVRLVPPDCSAAYGKLGYEALGLEARDGYRIPGQPDPHAPSERRSPGEGGPWRGTPEAPGSLRRPPPRDPGAGGSPEAPEPPGTLRRGSPARSPPGGPASPGPPSPGPGSRSAPLSASGTQGSPDGGVSPGSPTPAFPLATAYYEPPAPQPPLPEKRHPPPAPGGLWDRPSPPAAPQHVSFAPELGDGGTQGGRGLPDPQLEAPGNVKFVQDTSKFWYKPGLSRDQAIALLKAKEPGSFLIRDSNSFQGAYGLALKVATPPPNCVTHSKGDPQEQLVRHFLIETGPRGVKIKGCQNEPHFGSLPALVLQHSITPISLPCALRIPSKDPLEESLEVPVPPNMSTAADLLRQGAACSVLYLSSVETESLTGPQAVAKAAGTVLAASPRPPACTVHFKVSAQGITLTDSQRKLFFRRHYPVSNVTYCSTDPQDRRWANPDGTTSKIFGFVAKKPGGPCENACHLFAELDPEQPAAAIVNFITKVMLGTHRK